MVLVDSLTGHTIVSHCYILFQGRGLYEMTICYVFYTCIIQANLIVYTSIPSHGQVFYRYLI